MSLTLKVGSLVIKTLAKPIANYIKKNAHEHERFRKLCVGFAQRLHRIDMRMRLGLLQDSATLERRAAKEAEAAEARRRKTQTPTVKTEAQMKADEAAAAKAKEAAAGKAEKAEKAKKPPRIRQLTETKAIETGANFISEAFMFIAAGGALVFEQFRKRRIASERREDVEDRLEVLEQEREEMRTKVTLLEEQLAARRAEKAESKPTSARTTQVAKKQTAPPTGTAPGKT